MVLFYFSELSLGKDSQLDCPLLQPDSFSKLNLVRNENFQLHSLEIPISKFSEQKFIDHSDMVRSIQSLLISTLKNQKITVTSRNSYKFIEVQNDRVDKTFNDIEKKTVLSCESIFSKDKKDLIESIPLILSDKFSWSFKNNIIRFDNFSKMVYSDKAK